MVQETAWYFQQSIMVSSKPDLAMTVKANYKDNKPLYSLPLDNFFYYFAIITGLLLLEVDGAVKHWNTIILRKIETESTFTHSRVHARTCTHWQSFGSSKLLDCTLFLHPLAPPQFHSIIPFVHWVWGSAKVTDLIGQRGEQHEYSEPDIATPAKKKEQEKVWTFIQAYFVLFS